MFIHQQFTLPNLIETGYLSYIKQMKLITLQNIDQQYYQNRTPLHIAIISNQLQITEYLLSQFSPHLFIQDSLKLTPMHWLYIKVKYHHHNIFQPLYQKYSHLLNNQQQQPVQLINIPQDKLNICLAAELSLKQLQPLFNNNKSIYLKTHFNRKAHHWAAISGNTQIFKLLLEHKFDPYQQDSFGFTPYHYILANPNNPINKSINKNQNLITNNLTFQNLNNHYQAIIIGAGAAGIGAGITLSRDGLPYLVLEARQRIGGRLLSKHINEIQIDLGASWVHSCSKNNPIWKQAKKLNWQARKSLPFTDPLILSQLKQNIPQKDILNAMMTSQTYYGNVWQVASMSKDDISIEQAGRKYYNSHIATLDPLQKSLVDMFINMTENYNATSVQSLSAKYSDEQEDVGADWVPQQSYYKLISAIANSVDFQKKVKFNTQVKQIIYNNNNEGQYSSIVTKDGQVFYAKRIISSLPLGILKANKVKFTPPLPKQHQQSIQRLGWGIMNKVILSIDKPFWTQHPNWLRIACQQKGRYPKFYNFSTEDKHILCCFITDKFAQKISSKSDQQIIDELLFLLNKVSEKQEIKVIDYVVTRWDRDPYSLGSYSHFSVGSNMKTCKKLRESVDGKLWIVGQHCYAEHIGCAHGAYQTGLWAAEQLLRIVKKVEVQK